MATHKYADMQRPQFGMSEHPGSDCAAVARGNGLSFRPDQPACPGRPGHRRQHGPAGSWVCARGAAGPVAALTRSPGRARRGRPVPGGQDASRWLLPGGQPGLPAAVLARMRGGRIEVAVAWRRARGLRRHQPPLGTPAKCPRCPDPGCSRPPAGARTVSQLMPATGSEQYAIPGPAPHDRPVPAAAAPAADGRRDAIPDRPAPPTPGLPGRGHGTGGRHLRFHRHDQVGPSSRHRRPAAWDRPRACRDLGDGPSRLGQSGAVSCLTAPLSVWVWACPALGSLGYEGPWDLTGCCGASPELSAGLAGVARWAASAPLRAAVSPHRPLSPPSRFFRITPF